MKALILSHSSSLTGFGQLRKSFFLTQKVINAASGLGQGGPGTVNLEAATEKEREFLSDFRDLREEFLAGKRYLQSATHSSAAFLAT
jgi:hypothetical protein